MNAATVLTELKLQKFSYYWAVQSDAAWFEKKRLDDGDGNGISRKSQVTKRQAQHLEKKLPITFAAWTPECS